ncbi:ubiquitin-like-specific protease ESD4 isoform X2 [Manihot esculenta]|uniref:Ubiquitin-like protease family profile domain-containing protein n=1 Tax=Manihot esculenta TaxID=3983 RepID=A0A251LCH5_MANES|nr:ubiquitin-like-specific protease ESD4 isoform X2 [Manihot esculenta]OAY56009.1 hypothetical protein MANES_03G196000v8 [Manihot esculenta]
MGALTCISRQDPYSNSPDFHISKKPRLSFMCQASNQTLGSSNSTVSRISRYPATTSKFRREVHAPCRILKFGFSRSNYTDYSETKKSSADGMGNFLSKQLDFARRSAIDAFRYLLKYKQVIDVDNELEQSGKEMLSDDSSIEEVEAIEENGREGTSTVLDQRSRDGLVCNEDDNDVKIVEERSVVTVDENVGLQNARKMLDSLVLNGEVDVSSVDVYKKLLESAERRNGRLKALDSEIELNQKKLSFYQSTRPVKKLEEKAVEEIPHEPFIPLTKEEESLVKRAFSPNNGRKVLVTHKNSNIDITGEILQCLGPGAWLNDEVINLYLELLKEREKREPQKFLKCHFFTTFFYKKLTNGEKNIYDYRAVRRWTTERKLGYYLIECDKAKYYVDEVKDKSKKDIDVSNWKREFLEELPEQQNGYDCGVFMIKYADFYSRNVGLCFSQDHISYFRMRTAKEILQLRAD